MEVVTRAPSGLAGARAMRIAVTRELTPTGPEPRPARRVISKSSCRGSWPPRGDHLGVSRQRGRRSAVARVSASTPPHRATTAGGEPNTSSGTADPRGSTVGATSTAYPPPPADPVLAAHTDAPGPAAPPGSARPKVSSARGPRAPKSLIASSRVPTFTSVQSYLVMSRRAPALLSISSSPLQDSGAAASRCGGDWPARLAAHFQGLLHHLLRQPRRADHAFVRTRSRLPLPAIPRPIIMSAPGTGLPRSAASSMTLRARAATDGGPRYSLLCRHPRRLHLRDELRGFRRQGVARLFSCVFSRLAASRRPRA